MDEGRSPAVVVSSTGGAASKHRCLIGPVGTWASLPLDLLLEILRRLESTAVIRCTAACRSWRRAIIGNAAFLRPRPDRFLPSLLLGVFHGYGYEPYRDVWLRRTAGPLQSALPLNVAGYNYNQSAAQSSIPAAAAGKSRQDYGELLSSRDGFILLRGRDWMSGLCLCNPMTGDCAFVPNATIETDHEGRRLCTYILLTGYDLSLPTSGVGRSDDDLAVRILAVEGWNKKYTKDSGMKYQLLSFMSGGGGAGVWGPIRCSVQPQQGFWVLVDDASTTTVCRDVVHWLGGPAKDHGRFTGTVSLDLHTGRTWLKELPETSYSNTLLARTGDGRLSLIRSLRGHKIQVWVLNDGDRWSLQQTVDVQKQLHCREHYFTHTRLNAFCPRSGCVVATTFADQVIRIDLESGSCPRVECIGKSAGCQCKPYEMDWSTYISKMKRI